MDSRMRSQYRLFVTVAFLCIDSISFAARPSCDAAYVPTCDKIYCCNEMGGINYCDSSAGRYVCNNGYYSSCYCTRHAVMDLQKIEGCCLWQGGVVQLSETGHVVCRNGGVSEICSLQNPPQSVSAW